MLHHPVAFVLSLAIQGLYYVLLASIILSWLQLWQRSSRSAPRFSMDNPVVRLIESVSYSVLHPIRRVIDPYQRNTGIDFSAFVAILALMLIQPWVATLPF